MPNSESSKQFSSQTGLSLVEIMISVGLLSAIAIGVMNFMEVGRKSAKTVEASSEVNQLHDQIVLFLKNPANCRATFMGLRFDNQEEITLKKGINQSGEPDPDFRGITNDSSPVKLTGIKLYNPADPEGDIVPEVSRLNPPSEYPEMDGWWVVVRFRYAKYQSDNGKKRIFGGDTVDRYSLMKFDNFDMSQYTTDPDVCNSGDYTVAGSGKQFLLQGEGDEEGEAYWIGPCKNGDPAFPINDCVQ